MEQSRHIERYCPPTNLDKSPFGTIAKVIIDDGKHELYVQLGDEERSRWERVGTLLEEVFNEEFSSNSPFIDACLKLFKGLEKNGMDKSN